MRSDIAFVTGEEARVVVPDATALPDPVATAVVMLRGRELEVNAGSPASLQFFLSTTGSRLAAKVELRNGLVLRHGALGGRPATGRVYALTVGAHRLYGSCGARVGVADLAAWFARVAARPSPAGPSLRLGSGQAWARRMPSAVAQVVDLGADRGFLLDVRAARPAKPGAAAGLEVEGGRLSRSAPQERDPYLVLDTERALAYAIPRPGTPIDQVTEAMTRVRVIPR